ncbi:hypothetical protein QCB44_04980 [Thiomicrorhabdus sp. zzn3]|nr:hypothetical protein [Thiomicrorhabdus sp. zzn3]MDG6778056.1 hypothetical protein [Thiomicrorhabdus sp. zzn3]
MPDLDSISSALLLTLGLLGASILIVALLMWWLYRVFHNRDENQGHDS